MEPEARKIPTACGIPDFPYAILPKIENFNLGIEDLFLAREIASLAEKGLNFAEREALLLLILALRISITEGSTRLPLVAGGQLDRILDQLETDNKVSSSVRQLISAAQDACRGNLSTGLGELFGGPEDYRPLIFDHDCLYIQKLHFLERRVASALLKRIAPGKKAGEDKPDDNNIELLRQEAIKEVFGNPPLDSSGKLELDLQQQKAVHTMLSGRITIVSGRPGSGKTSIIATLLRILARTGNPVLESIALAAPTGKAADRMRQAITEHLSKVPGSALSDRELANACPPSSTLHRLLRYSPGQERFLHNETNPLSEQMVIVDESSMIDLTMMDHLLRALQPEAHLILLGDADQLPSIETGAVLRDLCRSESALSRGRVIELQKSYRASKEVANSKMILDTAAAIKNGALPGSIGGTAAPVLRNKPADLRFEGVELLNVNNEIDRIEFFRSCREQFPASQAGLKNKLQLEYQSGPSGFDEETTENLKNIFLCYDQFRILCVTRVIAGGTGTEAVNKWFHHRWLHENRDIYGKLENSPFLIGEPVLMTSNDYYLGLFNGDSGLILNVTGYRGSKKYPAEPMAVFPRGESFAAFPLATLQRRLDLAWATTVHKAQGSEYGHIAILLPEKHLRPLTRELLYTAVTRAKKSVVLVGSEIVLAEGIKHAMVRASGLAERLG